MEVLDLDIRKLYPKLETFVITSLSNCTNNLLNHVYFKTHPRTFLTKYIISLDIHLSLFSKYALDSVANWIDRSSDRIALCIPFKSVFKILAVSKAMYYIRQKDTVAAILSLLEMVNSKFQSTDMIAEYDTAASIIRHLGGSLSAPVSRSLEKLISVENGMITIDK